MVAVALGPEPGWEVRNFTRKKKILIYFLMNYIAADVILATHTRVVFICA